MIDTNHLGPDFTACRRGKRAEATVSSQRGGALWCLPRGNAARPIAATHDLERMSETFLEIRGTKETADGTRTEVLAVVFRPEPGRDQIHFSCLVRCPYLFDNDKRIAGVDADQALELALMFVRTMFGHHEIEIEDEL